MPSGIVTPGKTLAGVIAPAGSLFQGVLGLGPFIWFDANDPLGTGDNSSLADGAEVVSWKDKSGNGRHADRYSGAGSGPNFWRTAGVSPKCPNLPPSGLPYMNTMANPAGARGCAVLLNLNDGTRNSLNDFTLFCVMTGTAPAAPIPILELTATNDGSFRAPGIHVQEGTPDLFQYDAPTANPAKTSYRFFTYATPSVSTWTGLTMAHDGGAGGTAPAAWQDRGALAISQSSFDVDPDTNVLRFRRIFFNDQAGAPVQIQGIAELILYPYVLSAGDRTQVWNYLTAKWGVT